MRPCRGTGLKAIRSIETPRVHHAARRRGGLAAGGAGAAGRGRMRRVGVLMNFAADDTDAQTRIGAFLQALQELGWTIGRNVQIETRWSGGKSDDVRRYAAELVALAPDVILAHGTSTVRPLLQATRTVPIVFPVVGDPVAGGLVDSLARPGGNVTGFISWEFNFSGKWLELLKQVAPDVTRVAVLQDPTQGAGSSQFAAIQAVAPSLRVEVTPINLRDTPEIERAVADVARTSNGGLIVTGNPLTNVHSKLIIALAARHKLPAVYYESYSSPPTRWSSEAPLVHHAARRRGSLAARGAGAA